MYKLILNKSSAHAKMNVQICECCKHSFGVHEFVNGTNWQHVRCLISIQLGCPLIQQMQPFFKYAPEEIGDFEPDSTGDIGLGETSANRTNW